MPCRAVEQREARNKLASKLVRKLIQRLSGEHHEKRLISTNRLFPQGSFKTKGLREIFGGWAMKYRGKGRCMTKKLCKLVCKQVRQHFGTGDVPQGEAERLLLLIQVARKKKLKRVAMDCVETQPIDLSEASAGCLRVVHFDLASLQAPSASMVYDPCLGSIVLSSAIDRRCSITVVHSGRVLDDGIVPSSPKRDSRAAHKGAVLNVVYHCIC